MCICVSKCACTPLHTHRVDLYHLYCVAENGATHTCPLFPVTTTGSQCLRKDAEVSREAKFVREEQQLTFLSSPHVPGRLKNSSCTLSRWKDITTGNLIQEQRCCRSGILAPLLREHTAGLSSELAAGHWVSQECSSLAWQHAASSTPHDTAKQFGSVWL